MGIISTIRFIQWCGKLVVNNLVITFDNDVITIIFDNHVTLIIFDNHVPMITMNEMTYRKSEDEVEVCDIGTLLIILPTEVNVILV